MKKIVSLLIMFMLSVEIMTVQAQTYSLKIKSAQIYLDFTNKKCEIEYNGNNYIRNMVACESVFNSNKGLLVSIIFLSSDKKETISFMSSAIDAICFLDINNETFFEKYDQFHISEVEIIKKIDNEIATSKKNVQKHEYVDLGLPSGTLWATTNVGASSPEDYGSYFAWGETKPKSDYSWSTYKYANGAHDKLTKYNPSSSYGSVDNKKTLDYSDDAAYQNWGSDWCMPTYKQLDELRDQCTWKWTTRNGKDGYLVTSKKNGNTLFLPTAGCRYGTSFDGVGTSGYYWSRSLFVSGPSSARGIDFNSGRVFYGWYYRYFGLSVRPVRCR